MEKAHGVFDVRHLRKPINPSQEVLLSSLQACLATSRARPNFLGQQKCWSLISTHLWMLQGCFIFLLFALLGAPSWISVCLCISQHTCKDSAHYSPKCNKVSIRSISILCSWLNFSLLLPKSNQLSGLIRNWINPQQCFLSKADAVHVPWRCWTSSCCFNVSICMKVCKLVTANVWRCFFQGMKQYIEGTPRTRAPSCMYVRLCQSQMCDRAWIGSTEACKGSWTSLLVMLCTPAFTCVHEQRLREACMSLILFSKHHSCCWMGCPCFAIPLTCFRFCALSSICFSISHKCWKKLFKDVLTTVTTVESPSYLLTRTHARNPHLVSTYVVGVGGLSSFDMAVLWVQQLFPNLMEWGKAICGIVNMIVCNCSSCSCQFRSPYDVGCSSTVRFN